MPSPYGESQLQEKLSDIASKMARHNEEINNIERSHGSDPDAMPSGHAERYRNTTVGLARAREEYEETERQLNRYADVRRAANAGNVESGGPTGPQSDHDVPHRRVRRGDPWKSDDETPGGYIARAHESLDLMMGPQDSDRQRIAGVLDGQTSEASDFARYIMRTSHPAYKTAFLKMARDPKTGHLAWTDEERWAWNALYQDPVIRRTAMSLVDANGGALVPFTLDSTVILTNGSAVDPIRSLARVETITTDVWHGVDSQGITSEWTAEATEFADASPTFGSPSITPKKADTWVQGSWEVLADSNFASQLSRLLADSKRRLEAAAFATANVGATRPRGIVAATAAVTASIVTAATVSQFVIGDVFRADNGLTPRARENSNVSWLASHSIQNAMRLFDTTGGSAFWANLGQGMPPTLLGSPIYEVSNMQSAVTTSGLVLLGGDIREGYCIVDRVGMSVVFDQLVKGANRRPTGESGYAAFWRVGADVLNVDVLRVLSLHTTATAVALA